MKLGFFPLAVALKRPTRSHCPFSDDLAAKVKEALSASGVKSVEVKGTVTQQIGTIAVFQKDVPAVGDPRVLLLKMDDEQSAGLNLTNMNHAVFVHPLLADSQQEYDAYETQAIGRIRRYGTSHGQCSGDCAGILDRLWTVLTMRCSLSVSAFAGQEKVVHVWRFLAKDTIDTTIFSQRSSRVIPPPGEF